MGGHRHLAIVRSVRWPRLRRFISAAISIWARFLSTELIHSMTASGHFLCLRFRIHGRVDGSLLSPARIVLMDRLATRGNSLMDLEIACGYMRWRIHTSQDASQAIFMIECRDMESFASIERRGVRHSRVGEDLSGVLQKCRVSTRDGRDIIDRTTVVEVFSETMMGHSSEHGRLAVP